MSLSSRLLQAVAQHEGVLAVLTMVLCTYLARKGPPRTATGDRQPSFRQECVMLSMLCRFTGMLNAVALIESKGAVLHQASASSHVSRLLGMDDAHFAVFVLAFALGAAVAGLGRADVRGFFQCRYCPGLMSSALGATMAVVLQCASGGANWATLLLWAFTQGIQSSFTCKFTSVPLRSLHQAGTPTQASGGVCPPPRVPLVGELRPATQRRALLLLCLASYVGGGLTAKVGTDTWGIWAAMPAAAAMAALALGWLPDFELCLWKGSA